MSLNPNEPCDDDDDGGDSIPSIQISKIEPCHYNQIVTVQGTVIAIGPARPLIHEGTFKCETPGCMGEEQKILQPMGKFLAPKNCPSCEKGNRAFFRRLDLQSTYVPSQMIKISEILFDEKTCEKKNCSLDVHLINDLVEQCSLTDSVKITGQIVEPKTHRGQVICSFYLLASKIMKDSSVHLTERNMALLSEDNLLALLVASLCPQVPGNHFAKLGILLALVGGHDESEESDETNGTMFRGECHVLLLGDPTRGKRELLQAAHNVGPSSSFIDKSFAGNHVFEVESGQNDSYTLNAGPVLQANRGLCCIDDIDIIKPQRTNIMDIMETNFFQVGQKGCSVSMPVKISFLASCSPKNGSYDPTKTLNQNINLPERMLNQFDLIFYLEDQEEDLTNSSKILSQTRRPLSQSHINQSSSLKDKLKFPFNSNDLPPPKFLSLYIDYVRSSVFPKFSDDAIDNLSSFNDDFTEKANKSSLFMDPEHTFRTLMRLSIARARLEGRNTVMKEDALDVIELVQYSRFDLYPNDIVSAIASKAAKRVAQSECGGLANPKKRARCSKERLIRYIQDYSREHNKYLYTESELVQLKEQSGYQCKDFIQFIGVLNEQAYLLYKSGKYEVNMNI
ncbi:DNA helicase MCM8-like isoform X2 [Brevipalpus obovatus]|uniref:DNA helicase MCM8-like isoform X2 n=1 Tax=Brevipalpus obovatus TaxID=246614 RepID=UPI003D9F35E8